MKHSSVYVVEAWVCVETVHNSKLEFVLAKAGERQREPNWCHVQGHYVELLSNMIKGAGVTLIETQEYGDVMVKIQADTVQQLEDSLVKTDDIIRKWINKYHINSMK